GDARAGRPPGPLRTDAGRLRPRTRPAGARRARPPRRERALLPDWCASPGHRLDHLPCLLERAADDLRSRARRTAGLSPAAAGAVSGLRAVGAGGPPGRGAAATRRVL